MKFVLSFAELSACRYNTGGSALFEKKINYVNRNFCVMNRKHHFFTHKVYGHIQFESKYHMVKIKLILLIIDI